MSLTYDKKVPQKLKEVQQWFGSIISRPIDDDSRMMPISPSGNPMEEEAKKFIVPSPTLRPAERIQIYNQQYWWRLLGTLHENFPLLTRLFGYYDFNKTIGFPYIVKHPPQDWTLNLLGSHLIEWIKADYVGDDKDLVLGAAELDWAYNIAFFAAKHPLLDLKGIDPEKLISIKMRLQPYVHLFDFGCDMLALRKEMLKQEPDYWLDHDFPNVKKGNRFYFILSRNIKNNLVLEALTSTSHKMLSLFKEGASIETVCEWIENQEEQVAAEASENLQKWFHDWTARGWLVEDKL